MLPSCWKREKVGLDQEGYVRARACILAGVQRRKGSAEGHPRCFSRVTGVRAASESVTRRLPRLPSMHVCDELAVTAKVDTFWSTGYVRISHDSARLAFLLSREENREGRKTRKERI